jgi:putative transposase
MNKIDEIFTKSPFYGKRRISAQLNREGINIGVKKVRKLMIKMGLKTLYPKKKFKNSKTQYHKKYPYLLKDVQIKRNNQVWATDITYIKMRSGWIYLVAVLDWHSRYILSWEISITMEAEFCIKALESAIKNHPKPEIFNTHQGVQFTSNDFVGVLEKSNITISMDGKGRCFDNIFTERLWRTIKQEEVYIKDYNSVPEAIKSISEYIKFYNTERLHSSLNYNTPSEIYFSK